MELSNTVKGLLSGVALAAGIGLLAWYVVMFVWAGFAGAYAYMGILGVLLMLLIGGLLDSPLPFSISAVYCAHVVWGWGLFSSLLFGLPLLFALIALLLGYGTVGIFSLAKLKSKIKR